MAKERGWWKLNTTVELSYADKEHIAKCIVNGYIEGEVCEDEDDLNNEEEGK